MKVENSLHVQVSSNPDFNMVDRQAHVGGGFTVNTCHAHPDASEKNIQRLRCRTLAVIDRFSLLVATQHKVPGQQGEGCFLDALIYFSHYGFNRKAVRLANLLPERLIL